MSLDKSKKYKKSILATFIGTKRSRVGFVRRGLAVLVGLSGLLSILGSTRFARDGLVFNAWYGSANAWLLQHGIVTGFAFLYLARQIYQGERIAYRLTLGLMILQVIKFSLFERRFMPLIIYSLLLLIIILSKDYFVRHSSPRRFMGRLRAVVIALVVSVVVITLLGALSRLGQPEIWEQSTFNAGRVVMRATLLEISTNPKDPLTARLFGQVLTAAGFAMYAWILAGLFSPSLYSRQHAEEAERERMLALLDEHGSTSEDSFKLWPHDKRYWFNTSDTAGIAYKQHKGFVIGLEAPVGGAHAKSRAATAFRDHCRAHGWKLAWLFADKKSAEVNDLKTLKIGASAVVTIDEFATNTVRNKWWRWVRNKNSKLGLRYDVLTAPFNDTDRGQLKSISTAWLGDNKHSERTFALGYFDETFLTTCTVHVLRNEDGVIIAFANQLPSYHHNTQATIDLMRSSPGYDGAVTYLLSETLLGMYAEGRFKTFDLGFVPLAQNEEAVRKKAVLNLTTTLFNAYFSARGLRQFKNKFEPEWHDTYLAWDGDWLDLPALAQAIDKVLTYTSSNPSE